MRSLRILNAVLVLVFAVKTAWKRPYSTCIQVMTVVATSASADCIRFRTRGWTCKSSVSVSGREVSSRFVDTGAAASPIGVSHDLLDVGVIAPHAGKSQKGLSAGSCCRRP